jgi:predicted DNA-binding protein
MGRAKTGRFPSQISFQVSAELFERLKMFSTVSGVPMSEVIRRAITQWLEKENG